ncbi:acyl-CoA thioester hydrolase/BAAT C-terminal domain-containing protein [Streptomyces sp. NPDC007206]|uniref:acyl-CoA thioester hydrolase/BAAT C-terminal domain-containing protein n=1 Tax=Streptomyces sp. NPDC007206 TaxID=3154317 RepID=UPI00340E7EF2
MRRRCQHEVRGGSAGLTRLPDPGSRLLRGARPACQAAQHTLGVPRQRRPPAGSPARRGPRACHRHGLLPWQRTRPAPRRGLSRSDPRRRRVLPVVQHQPGIRGQRLDQERATHPPGQHPPGSPQRPPPGHRRRRRRHLAVPTYANAIIGNLRAAHDRYPYQKLVYPGAGHGVGTFPFLAEDTASPNPSTGVVDNLGGSRAGDAAAREKGWPKLLAFLADTMR